MTGLLHTQDRSGEQRQRQRKSDQDASTSSSSPRRCASWIDPYMFISQVKVCKAYVLPSVRLLPLGSKEDLPNVVSLDSSHFDTKHILPLWTRHTRRVAIAAP
jgi:hypothetical protein